MVSKLSAGRPTRQAGLGRVVSLSNVIPQQMSYRQRSLLDLVRQIRDYNADAGKEVSNILRLANSGWTLEVVGRDGVTADEAGLQIVLDLARQVAREYGGGLDVLIDMIHLTAATQGAAAMEVELTEGLDFYDMVPVNPWLVDFDRDSLGHWVTGIREMGQFNPLNPLQFLYVPVDPEPDGPQGRSPFGAVLDIVFFQMEVLRDLKAAAHFAGYPRVSISVAMAPVLELIRTTRPDLMEPHRADDLRQFMDQYLGDITDMVDDLEADDALVAWDAVTADYIVPSGKTIDIRDLIDTIDKQIVSGLKSLPIMLGRNEGATTTHGTVQWQVYAQSLAAYQRISKRLIEWGFGLALRVMGRQNIVRLTYEPIRTSDREADARAEFLETQNAILQEQSGYIDHDEAAQRLTGHDAQGSAAAVGVSTETVDRLLWPGVGRGQRAVEDVTELPWWQQVLYAEAEQAAGLAYRDQIRAAWQRMRRNEAGAT